MEILQPIYLHANEKVVLVSTSYSPNKEDVAKAADTLRSWELEPIIDSNAVKTYSKNAGTIQEHVSDLQWAFSNPDIKAVICNRGGYGAIQLLEHLRPSEWDIEPKWLAGFSDSTTLHDFNSSWHHEITRSNRNHRRAPERRYPPI